MDCLNDLFQDENEFTSEVESKLQTIIADVNGLITGFLQEHEFLTIRDMTQQEYTGLLRYIAFSYFRPTKCLYKYYPGVSNDHRTTMQYDDDLLCGLCEYYIYMSMINNKVVNPMGFSCLVGCDVDLLRSWSQQESQRPRASGIVKTLKKLYESSLENGAQSGKNPVGYIAALNHRFGWDQGNKTSVTLNITQDNKKLMSTIDPKLLESMD